MRAIVNGVHFYASKAAIREQRSGDNSLQNTALFHVLTRMGKDPGHACSVILYDAAGKRCEFAVQLTR